MQTVNRDAKTQVMVDLFVSMKEGDVLSWNDLAAQCDLPPTKVRNRYQSARRIALRDHHIVMDVVRGVGVTKQPQTHVPGMARHGVVKIRRAAQRNVKLIRDGVTDFAKLPADGRHELLVAQAQSGAVALATSAPKTRRLTDHVRISNDELKFGQTLELLKD